MNYCYLDQAAQYARRNPHDSYAQALWAHWVRSMAQIEAMRAGPLSVAPLQELGADVAAGGPRGPHHHDALAGAHALPLPRGDRAPPARPQNLIE